MNEQVCINKCLNNLKNYECLIIMNTDIVNILCNFKYDSYIRLTSSFPKFIATQTVKGNKRVHALCFMSKEDRDKVYDKFKRYSERIKEDMPYPFFYKGENILTTDALKELEENNGDFKIWEKYYE